MQIFMYRPAGRWDGNRIVTFAVGEQDEPLREKNGAISLKALIMHPIRNTWNLRTKHKVSRGSEEGGVLIHEPGRKSGLPLGRDPGGHGASPAPQRGRIAAGALPLQHSSLPLLRSPQQLFAFNLQRLHSL